MNYHDALENCQKFICKKDSGMSKLNVAYAQTKWNAK